MQSLLIDAVHLFDSIFRFLNGMRGKKRDVSSPVVPSPPMTQISAEAFSADVEFLESNWRRLSSGGLDLPVLDLGSGDPLVFVPILEHLEFVYARQVRTFSRSRRVILYRRQESRTRFVRLAERVEELRKLCDALEIAEADFVGHGDAAMVLFEFALRYPRRCRSLVIIAQGADYQIAPHPLIWLLHEAFLRLPIEHLIPAAFIRKMVIRYITHSEIDAGTQKIQQQLTCLPAALIEAQFRKIVFWPAVYRYSVLPVIHSFDIRGRLERLTMPVLLINRADDLLSPEAKTSWLAQHLPHCAGYHVVPGCERFFLYAEAELVNPFIQEFLATLSLPA